MCPAGINLVMATAEGHIRLFKISRYPDRKPRVMEVTGKAAAAAAATTPKMLTDRRQHGGGP